MTVNAEQQTASDTIEAMQEFSGARDYTHRSIEETRRALKIGRFEYWLLWLAKTDFHVLSISTYHSRARLQGLGLMVIFTSLLAFSTSFYTLLTTLIGPDSPGRWFIAGFLALVYTFGIVIIDREIVGSTTNSLLSTLVRLVFAFFIATAVSYPAKLKFFEGRINHEIEQIVKEQNAETYDRIDEIKRNADSERRASLANVQSRIDSTSSEIAIFDKQIKEEQDRGFCGPKCDGFRIEKRKLEQKLMLEDQQLEAEQDSEALSRSMQEEISALNAKIESQPTYDILYKTEALNRITDSDANLRLISNFLVIFFILLELVPLALKWSMGHTEYHYYIEARNNINKQKIASITNFYIEQMQRDKNNIWQIPLEVTDMIALALEDESRAIERRSSLTETLDSVWRKSRRSVAADAREEANPDGAGVKNSPDTDPETLRE